MKKQTIKEFYQKNCFNITLIFCLVFVSFYFYSTNSNSDEKQKFDNKNFKEYEISEKTNLKLICSKSDDKLTSCTVN